MEEWRPIKGFCSYEVSSKGRIRSNKGRLPKILIGGSNRGGYKCYNLRSDESKTYFKTIHRIVALTFIPNPQGLEFVNHIDKDKSNNCKENLEWCSSRENNTHMRKTMRRTSSYTGVYYDKSRKKWYATIKINCKPMFLGRFINESDAGKAYIEALNKHNISNKYAGYNSI